MEALGMQSGDIPHSAITSSSFGGSGLAPYVGRLHFLSSGSGKQGSWAAGTSDENQWFQVDFGNWTKITAVATQGRQDYDEWVESYNLAYSYDGVFYIAVEDEEGHEKTFQVNSDRYTVVKNEVDQPITTKFIRILPQTWKSRISMRTEFYGCKQGIETPDVGCTSPLGMAKGTIPDAAIVASSRYNQYGGPERARLNMQKQGNFYGGWTSQYTDAKQFLQIDLGQVTKVTRIAHQGRSDASWWTKTYTLSYSDDGGKFMPYNNSQVIEGNKDSKTAVGRILDPPIVARFLKINVQSFYGYPTLRIELYGCTEGFPTPATPPCIKALGMQSGDIPDSAITASSFGGSGLAPYVGRLHFLSSGSGKQGSWAARTSDVNQWFQVNFGKWTKITAVASQGRQDSDEWVGSYTLAYSYEGVFYTPVNREDGLIKTFTANSDRYTVVKNELDQSVITKFIRILPKTWKSRISMRTEFYGCDEGFEIPDVGCTSPLGMEKGTIPDSAIVASSRYNQYAGPERARLNLPKQGNFYGGWTSQYTDAKQFLQIDLGQVTKVTRIAHQGRSDASWWTKTYTLSYSDDGGKFMPYNNSQVIDGNTDSKTAVGRILDPPIVARFLKINVQSFYGYPTLRIELYGCTEDFPTPATPPCMKALGMQSGDIPDSAVTASSFGGSGLAPYVGRLHFLSSGSGKQGSWAARTSDVNQWFQVNFGKWTKITAVASQGRQDSDEWVGSYTLAYSYEGVFYTPVNREDGLIKTFTANSDRYTVVKNELDQSIITKFIRILPKTWKSRISMRTEFYGCDEGFEIPDEGCTSPLGMEKGTIPDSAIVASSRYNQYAGPERARLNLPKQGSNYGGWSSQFGGNEQFLQIDLGQVTKVTRIAHQGRSDANWWTTSYTLSYSNDGVTFKPYNNSQTLQGNNDATTAVGRILDPPIVARFLKINVQSFNGYPALRVELYGCTDGFSTPTPSKCMDALGMQSGVIPNSAVTASSSFNANSPPYIGRLHFLSAGSGKYGSWISGRNNLDQWFQVDFGSWTKVRGVSTQGRQDAGQWVGKYSLSFSYDGIFYQTVNDETGLKKIFNANSDQYSVVRNTLDTPIITRYIRIQPETWNAYIAMRTEFYGCREGNEELDFFFFFSEEAQNILAPTGCQPTGRSDGSLKCLYDDKFLVFFSTFFNFRFDPPEIVCADALGMESGDIPDSALTSSSDYNQYFGAQRSRLKSERNGSYYGGWASKSLDYNQWLQIDLRNLTKVTRIATQGLHDASWWVTKYKLSYSSGDKFEFYNNGEEITGNMDRNTAEGRILDPPILARYFRINPTAWYGRLSMRVELFGCRGGTD
ncbi:uncharacterized protein [Montipora foliosa]|uniref:uncharacterized protein n=1 Tax=Montipora foliosa TaxID=591990 RepID=UPI0035F19EE3